jgi:hypothetical protein
MFFDCGAWRRHCKWLGTWRKADDLSVVYVNGDKAFGGMNGNAA